jgi:hypothetical protein
VTLRCGSTNAGCYKRGEHPAPLQYQFQDATGAPLPSIVGYTVKFQLREQWADPATTQQLAGTIVDPALAIVQYAWTGNEWTTPGTWFAEFWIGNGLQRFCSDTITMTVGAPIGPVPNI